MYACCTRKYNRIYMVIESIFFSIAAVKCDKCAYIHSAHVIHITAAK